MVDRYAKYAKFIRDTIVSAGFTKSNGNPNIDAFYRRFSPTLKNTGLSLSKTSFNNQVNGADSSPYGQTLEAMAVILSAARGEKVTVAMLDGLIVRPALKRFKVEVDESDLPNDEAAAEIRAEALLKEFMRLPIDTRSAIAPKLLRLLANDWEYLDSPQFLRISKLLQSHLVRQGYSLEHYAKTVLRDAIPLETLQAIREGRMPATPLTSDQVLRLQQHLKSIDGDELDLIELDCLIHLDRLRE